MTITLSWWAIPLAITLAAFWWALFRETTGSDLGAAIDSAFGLVVALIVSLVAWLVYALKPGDRYRYEQALIDSDYWGRYRVCLPCIDKFLRDFRGEDDEDDDE
jgi:hypothetical protein